MSDMIQNLRSPLRAMRGHYTFMFTLVLLLAMVAMILRAHQLSNLPPDQAVIEEATSSTQPIQFNQSAIDSIKMLKDSNVDVPVSNLPGGRTNPFGE